MIIRCKSCGKNIQYDIALQKLHCGQCGSNFDPADYSDDSPTFDACTYTCQSCGAELISTEDTEATAFCSYCGSTSILTGRMEKIKKPDTILPFRITREKCREIYLNKTKETFMVPGWLRDEKCVNSFRAIYMPYWSYRIVASGHISKIETSQKRDGDYIIETTKDYRSDDIEKSVGTWSHDASKEFSDDISELMDFTHVSENAFKPFHEGYLSGFYADLADETARAHKDIAKDETRLRLGGRNFRGSIDLQEHRLSYMPVWFMSARNKNRITYAAIDGYSGRIIADFPISTWKFLAMAAAAATILAIFLSLVLVLRPEPAFWCSAVLTLIGLIYCGKEETRLLNISEATGWPLYKQRSWSFSGRMIVSIVFCLLCALLLLTKNNLMIYGAVLCYAFVLCMNCICVFRIHQENACRRPPQFNRKGAMHDA